MTRIVPLSWSRASSRAASPVKFCAPDRELDDQVIDRPEPVQGFIRHPFAPSRCFDPVHGLTDGPIEMRSHPVRRDRPGP